MRIDRLKDIETYIRENLSVTIPELCSRFDVSLNTIRRDISVLVKGGSIFKVYGGVVFNQERRIIPYSDRCNVAVEEKIRIGSQAGMLVEDGDTLYIDSGTTTVQLLPHIAIRKGITIVSNSLAVFNEIQRYPTLSLLSVGGIFNQKTKSFVGQSAIQSLDNVRITKAFMGASGVGIKEGATNNSLHEAEIKRAVIRSAQKIILMVSHDKLDHTAAICFCSLDRLHAFITDSCPPDEFVQFLEQNGIQLIY